MCCFRLALQHWGLSHQGPAGGAVLVAPGDGCLSKEKTVRVSAFRDFSSAVGILVKVYSD